jgi:hypothetical protein
MKKIIRARLYLNTILEDQVIKNLCDKMDLELEGWPILYDCYIAEYEGEEVIEFEVDVEGHTYKDCETFYSYFKRTIKDVFKVKVNPIIKVKAERI